MVFGVDNILMGTLLSFILLCILGFIVDYSHFISVMTVCDVLCELKAKSLVEMAIKY